MLVTVSQGVPKLIEGRAIRSGDVEDRPDVGGTAIMHRRTWVGPRIIGSHRYWERHPFWVPPLSGATAIWSPPYRVPPPLGLSAIYSPHCLTVIPHLGPRLLEPPLHVAPPIQSITPLCIPTFFFLSVNAGPR